MGQGWDRVRRVGLALGGLGWCGIISGDRKLIKQRALPPLDGLRQERRGSPGFEQSMIESMNILSQAHSSDRQDDTRTTQTYNNDPRVER